MINEVGRAGDAAQKMGQGRDRAMPHLYRNNVAK